MDDQQHIKEIIELKTAHLAEIIELRSKLNEIAIQKAETALLERMESSNNKFGLLKEQAAGFATKADLKSLDDKINVLTRFMYIAIGGLAALEFVIMYLK